MAALPGKGSHTRRALPGTRSSWETSVACWVPSDASTHRSFGGVMFCISLDVCEFMGPDAARGCSRCGAEELLSTGTPAVAVCSCGGPSGSGRPIACTSVHAHQTPQKVRSPRTNKVEGSALRHTGHDLIPSPRKGAKRERTSRRVGCSPPAGPWPGSVETPVLLGLVSLISKCLESYTGKS